MRNFYRDMGINMIWYKTGIVYDKDTVNKLGKIIYNTYHFKQKAAFVCLSLVLIATGAGISFIGRRGTALIVLGLLLLASLSMLSKREIRKTMQQMQGKKILMEYVFKDNEFECRTRKGTTRCKYDKIMGIVENKGYFYLFPDSTQAYMMDLKMVPEEKHDDFREFLCRKTQKQIQKLNILQQIL